MPLRCPAPGTATAAVPAVKKGQGGLGGRWRIAVRPGRCGSVDWQLGRLRDRCGWASADALADGEGGQRTAAQDGVPAARVGLREKQQYIIILRVVD